MKKIHSLVILLLFTVTSVFAADQELVKASDYGNKWPFTVKKGSVACPDGKSVIFLAGGKKYALNGVAKSKGYTPIEPIWRYDPEMIKMQKEIAKSEKKSLKEIQKIMGPTPRVNIGPILDLGVRLCR